MYVAVFEFDINLLIGETIYNLFQTLSKYINFFKVIYKLRARVGTLSF